MMDNAFRVAFLLCTVASAFGAFWLGISGEPGAGVTMAGLAAIFAAFTFLTKFKRFKGLGFEGELWEQEMEQAAELRRGLKDLAEQLGESVAWQMGFWSGGPFQERLAVIERTITILLNIGVSQVNIDELTRRWHNVVMTRLAEPIAHRTRGELKDYMFNEVHKGIMAERKQRMEERPGTQEPTSREAAHCWKQYKSLDRVYSGDEINGLITRGDYENVPRALRAFIDQAQWLTPKKRETLYQDCSEAFRDIDQYARERTIRRPEVLNA